MKLKAFTLIELVVALAISGIVIGIVYSCYQITGGYYAKMKAENELTYEYHLFHALLNEDFDKSEYIGRQGESALKFHFPDHEVVYDFYDEYVTRNREETPDTFRIKVDFIDFHELNDQLIDELSIETVFQESALPVHFRKIYAADVRMKMKP